MYVYEDQKTCICVYVYIYIYLRAGGLWEKVPGVVHVYACTVASTHVYNKFHKHRRPWAVYPHGQDSS